MTKLWTPSWWGRHLTESPDWRLHLEGLEFSLVLDGRTHRVSIEDESSCRVRAGVFWTDITLHLGQGQDVKVDGLPNIDGAALAELVNISLEERRLREDVVSLKANHQTIERWLELIASEEQRCAQQRQWFTHEQQEAVIAARPTVDVQGMRDRLNKSQVRIRLGQSAKMMERSLAAWSRDYAKAWAALNAAHVERELLACKDLLDRVESMPLTSEQARAVVCFDNRVQVVASAGSGKTSTMVAKAAYALHRGLVDPKRVVLLAFNKQTAEELKERAALAFERLGMADIAVEASTFHALGLRLIGRATGEKPDIPDWATDVVGGVRKLTEIVDVLKDRSTVFRRQWDMFRFVFGKDLQPFGATESADVWDSQGIGALVTVQGERVKSQEEVMIANWLFLNGVAYQYEGCYEIETADEDHRQYKPDFYYPAIGLYHEHFALDAQGNPPERFERYMEGVIWKRKLHAQNGTLLFETTSHGLRHCDDFYRLERKLVAHGLLLDPNPDRKIPENGRKPLESIELIGLIRTFMSHAKSNGLSKEDLQRRIDAMP